VPSRPVELRMLVGQLLRSLPAREAEILRLRFYEELTQSEIAERLGISQMHVSRLIRRCLLELRETLDR
jgi:RNA polymerase sigma-B factor